MPILIYEKLYNWTIKASIALWLFLLFWIEQILLYSKNYNLMLSFMLIYLLLLNKPNHLPLISILLLSLIKDSYLNFPLGESGFIFFIFSILTIFQKLIFIEITPLIDCLGFYLNILIVIILHWLLNGSFKGEWSSINEILKEDFLIIIIIYSLLRYLLKIIKNNNRVKK